MRDIYPIDFENVASEGLSGITYLSPEDQVIIFYSANSNRLSMKMHILIGKSTCNLNYFEVSVGGKNALDHQISTWLGYLIGTGAAASVSAAGACMIRRSRCGAYSASLPLRFHSL